MPTAYALGPIVRAEPICAITSTRFIRCTNHQVLGLVAAAMTALCLGVSVNCRADELGIAEAPSSEVESAPVAEVPSTGDMKLRFAFSGAPWREVLRWLADESGLALHVGDLPVGSFTYSDPDEFSVDEAISRVNLFLIPQGYGVVKRGGLLSVISLADPRSLQQLDALAIRTSVNQLDQLSSHEIVKCTVPIGDLVVDDVLAELRPLMLMTAPVVLPRTKQIIVTDTAGKVASVIEVVESLKVPAVEPVVKRFDLKYVDVSSVMAVAAPHLGVPVGQMEGVEISVSSDVAGKVLFVTGTPEKVAKLESLIKVVDLESPAAENVADMTLRSHSITGDNLQAVFEVLQTVLAGKPLRLSMQPTTKSIVALADAQSHQVIESTIKEMQAPAIEFAVVELGSLDPYFTLNLIEEMFAGAPVSRERDRDAREPQPTPPKVDADPGNRRLFVRGTADQISQVKQLVSGLATDRSTGRTTADTVRVLPLKGQQRRQLLEAAGRYWQGDNRILINPSSDELGETGAPIERLAYPEESSTRKSPKPVRPASAVEQTPSSIDDSVNLSTRRTEALVSVAGEASTAQPGLMHSRVSAADSAKNIGAPIRSQLVPQGILLQSDDVEALDQFEQQLLELAEMSKHAPSPPVIYYLKYVDAEDAVKMLADLIDGGRSLADTPGNTLVRGSSLSPSSSGLLGSFTTQRDGVTTVIAGTATIVSDARLNRLIVQGTTEDVAVIDEYMKIVDKANSITSIETFGRSHVIELQYTRATEVAEMLKQAFGNRIASSGSSSSQSNQRPGEPTGAGRPGDEAERRDGNEAPRDVAEKPTRGRIPEMTIAAHEPSNTLIITAPDALYEEVHKLVESIDTRSEQVVEVVAASGGIDVEAILRRLNGENFERASSSSQSGSSSRASSSRSTTSRSSSSPSRRGR